MKHEICFANQRHSWLADREVAYLLTNRKKKLSVITENWYKTAESDKSELIFLLSQAHFSFWAALGRTEPNYAALGQTTPNWAALSWTTPHWAELRQTTPNWAEQSRTASNCSALQQMSRSMMSSKYFCLWLILYFF